MKIIIVGGVAGGATAAAKARRENEFAEITVYERGPYISFANCGLPYYIGGEIHDRDKLLQLRDRLGEIPKDRPIIVYCQKGQRGYIGTRILQQHGFANVANLKGGFLQAKAAGLANK